MAASAKRINVLLVNPTFAAYAHSWPPLGLAYLAAALRRAGHAVRIFDPTPNQADLTLIKNDFVPDLIGISVVSPMRRAAFLIAEKVRAQTHIPIVVGGPDVTSCWCEHLKHPAIDFAVVGEGERTIVELADRIAEGCSPDGVPGVILKSGGGPIANPPRDLMEDVDEAPIPARDLLDMSWYGGQTVIRGSQLHSTTVLSARGCPRTCVFCDSRRTWTRQYRPHSAERVVEELRSIQSNYGIHSYQFLDDTFPVLRGRTLELCERFARDLPGIHWSCQARVGALDEELVLAMKAAGCVQMEFGVESGSQRILDFLKKGFSVEEVRETFALCRKHGVRTYANFIVGTPDETMDDVRASFVLYREIQPNAGDLWVATPYPGTDLYNHCVENGLLDPQYLVEALHHGHELGDQYFIKSTLTQEQIRRLMDVFYGSIRRDWDYPV